MTGTAGPINAAGIAYIVGAIGIAYAFGAAEIVSAAGAVGAVGIASAAGAVGAADIVDIVSTVDAASAIDVGGVVGAAGAVDIMDFVGAAGVASAIDVVGVVSAVGAAHIISAAGAAGIAGAVGTAGVVGAAGAVGAAAGVCAVKLYRRVPAKWVCDAGEEVREAHMPHMRKHGHAAGIGCAAAVTLLLLKDIFFGTFAPAAAALSISALIALAAAAQCDIQYQIIPDQASVFLLAAGLLRAVFSPLSPVLPALSESISGSAAGFLTMVFCAVLSRLLCRREGIGMGDVKLIGACGALVGINQIFYLILISSLTGAVFAACAILFRRSDIYSTYPMAPWIFLGTSVCFIIG